MTRTMTIAFACATALALGATTGSARDGGERAAGANLAPIVPLADAGRNAAPRAPRVGAAPEPAAAFMAAAAGTPDSGRNGCPRVACGSDAE